jgi:transposase InsO family protein
VSDVRRLRELETENAKLKRMYADLALENAAINGPEFCAQPFVDWAAARGSATRIQPGKPDQNAYVERFHRTYRTEVLTRISSNRSRSSRGDQHLAARLQREARAR